VLLFKKHIASISFLDGIYLASGDVNGSGSLTASDVLLIKKRIAFIIGEFSVGDWLFNNSPVIVSGGNVTQNFNGLCYGDANGSYMPSAKGNLMAENQSEVTGTLAIGNFGAQNGNLTVPLYAYELSNLGSFQFTIAYDASKLTFSGTDGWFTGIDGVVVGNPQPGKLTFVWAADGKAISMDGNLVCNLHFQSHSMESSSVSWSDSPTPREFADFDGVIFNPAFTHGNFSPVAVSGPATGQTVSIFPNPANDFIMVRSTEEVQFVNILTTLGVVVHRQAVNSKEARVPVSALQNGFYLMQFETTTARINRSVLIKK